MFCGVQLRQPLGLNNYVPITDLCGVRNDRPKAGCAALETAKPRASAAVSRDLPVVKSVCSHTDNAAEQRQMLRDRYFKVKPVPSLVIRSEGKTAFQSFFILITIQPLSLASVMSASLNVPIFDSAP